MPNIVDSFMLDDVDLFHMKFMSLFGMGGDGMIMGDDGVVMGDNDVV